MSDPENLTVAVLREIRGDLKDLRTDIKDLRGEVVRTNERLDSTNARLDATNERLEGGLDSLARRIVESEMRTATAITELSGDVRELTTFLRGQADLRPRVDRCEREIDEIKRTIAT
jgi:predicted  nucleic acid-binding Zn-ribbon protein